MITEYSKVKTLVQKGSFEAGRIGVVVSLYTTGPACEVELRDENDHPIDVVTYLLSEVTKIR